MIRPIFPTPSMPAGWWRARSSAAAASTSWSTMPASGTSRRAAKHAVVGLAEVTALATATSPVTRNVICPGFVLTPVVQTQIRDARLAAGRRNDGEAATGASCGPAITGRPGIKVRDTENRQHSIKCAMTTPQKRLAGIPARPSVTRRRVDELSTSVCHN
jgi:NAD(P)-dependent dehydrogenase (short-subunit alcohol dehydrogenase family)